MIGIGALLTALASAGPGHGQPSSAATDAPSPPPAPAAPLDSPTAAPKTALAADRDRPLTGLPAPLVDLRAIDASIVTDIRYAGPDNFTGAPVPGYRTAACILTRRTAEALARVQRDLAARGLSLIVYDCYRPPRAVAAFVRWSKSTATDPATARFHPALPRTRLIEGGYIAARSGHSRGHTVDIGLMSVPPTPTPAFEPGRRYGPCTGPREDRAPDPGLDMGTGFDCFDPKSHLGAASITRTQAENRRLLVDAMTREGFVAYAREWSHFSYPPGDPGRVFDIDVGGRPSGAR